MDNLFDGLKLLLKYLSIYLSMSCLLTTLNFCIANIMVNCSIASRISLLMAELCCYIVVMAKLCHQIRCEKLDFVCFPQIAGGM